MNNIQELLVGDIVKVNASFLDNEPGSIGLVYETYQDFDDSSQKGVSIILENGCNLGGFSRKEQHEYLEFVKSSNFEYEFKNVIQLDQDFRKGVFKEAFL
ncbi:MAG: hypothetical protein AABY15_02690 [Nanoarchaeota archaeon]